MRIRAIVGVVAVLALFSYATPSSLAGNGTSGNPWLNEHVLWTKPFLPSWVGRVFQDLTITVSDHSSFYSANSRMAQEGFYVGLARDGNLRGSQSGSGAMIVIFSLFGTSDASTYRRLNTFRCDVGADSQGGVSCSMPFAWSIVTQYRVSVDITLASNQAVCPTSTWVGSGAACLVYTGYVGLTSNPYVRTAVASISADPSVYGDVQLQDNFVEDFREPFCNVRPRASFMLPWFHSNDTGQDYPSPNSYSSDSGQSNECGRSYEFPYGANIRLVVT